MSRGLPRNGLCAALDGVDGEEGDVDAGPVEGPPELGRWSDDREDTSLTFQRKRLGRSGDETVVLDRSVTKSVTDTPSVSQRSAILCDVGFVVLFEAAWETSPRLKRRYVVERVYL